MKFVRRVLRVFGLWVVPPVALALILTLSLAWWCVASQTGTRWLLSTVAAQLGGHAQGVRGSLSRDLYVADLALALPDLDVRVIGLHLKALWPELLQRRLHINDLSASRVDVDVRTAPDAGEEPPAPFQLPALPLGLRVDRLALGGLGLRIDGMVPPVELLGVSTALTLDARSATITLDTLRAAHADTLLQFEGHLVVQGLAAPWPFELALQATAIQHGEQSPVCLRRLLQTAAVVPPSGSCRVDLELHAAGTLQAFHLQASARGEGLHLQADAQVYPERGFPLGETRLTLTLPDEAGLELTVTPGVPAADGLQPVELAWSARHLRLTPWLPQGLGTTTLNLRGALQARLTPTQQLQDLGLTLTFDGPNRWNGQPLSGAVRLARLARVGGPLFDVQADTPLDPFGLVLGGLDVALDLGPDRVRAKGDVSAAASQLSLQAHLPALAALWPGLPGGAELDLDSAGSLARHEGKLKARYVPDKPQDEVPGQAPVSLQLAFSGGWSPAQGWRGQLSGLQVQHAGMALRSQAPIALELDAAGGWQVGQAALDLSLKGDTLLQLRHEASSGSHGHWATRGRIDPLIVTPERISRLQAWLGQGADRAGGVHSQRSGQARDSRLALRLTWDLAFADALSGDIALTRVGGDLTVPGDVPIPLGLRTASLDLALRRTGPGLSRLAADLQVRTRDMGSLRLRAETPLHGTPGGAPFLLPKDEKRLHLEADSEDLAWVNLLLGGAIEIGGRVHADVQGRSLPDGQWTLSGPLRGEKLSVLMLDQGVRLLDGTLQAHFDGQDILLDHLRFPAVRRVTPSEWRTATWVAENPDAQDGSLDLSGRWRLANDSGQVTVNFHRYPILQRSDRYAMISGALQVQATLPEIVLSGKITADAGWFDLDMLNDIPSLDSDVVVLKPGEQVQEIALPPALDLKADVTVDLGPRFYLTGFGLDSGLTGSLDLHLRAGKLTALGVLRTRGGAIDAYGQHLQLRKGTVTFQGNIANPVLDIEALRTDVSVHAGVRVAGTARRPRIDLMSIPDVSETEKLTWLLLGHGPDAGGGDMTLLFSVGSSFLSDGEPFYKRFGLDELSMRSGELGSTGSILPAQSVVSGPGSGASPIEQRFVMASKTLTSDLRVSLEQALAQTGTVARLSYRLMRGLRAEVTAGTVNGLALVYQWFSAD